MPASSVFQSHTINSSPTNLSISNPNIFLEPGAEIRNSYVSDGLYMERYSGLSRTTTVGPCGIGSFSYVSDSIVSAYCHVGPRTSVGGFEHPFSSLSQSSFFWGQNIKFWHDASTGHIDPANLRPVEKTTILEPDVWVGANCVVKSGLQLATGSIIGAGSILTKSTEPYGIYVGNPAVLLKFRFTEDVISSLLGSEWWKLPFSFLYKLNLSDLHGSLERIYAFKSTNPT